MNTAYHAVEVLKTWDVMTAPKHPLAVDLLVARAPLQCCRCQRRAVKGEPVATFFVRNDWQSKWRRSLCGLCFADGLKDMKAALDTIITEFTELSTKLSDFYVAKEIAGPEGRKNLPTPKL